MKNYKKWRGMTSLLILVLCLCIFLTNLAFTRAGDVNLFLGTLAPSVEVNEDTNYYPSDFENKEQMRAGLKQHIIDAQIEGSVLLKNDENALPLQQKSVTLFGGGAVNSIYHGGSGGPANTGINLYDALKTEGFEVNDTMYNMMKNANTSYSKKGNLGEIPVSSYQNLESSYASKYNDAAIVVLRRYGGEEGELNHGLDGIWQDGPVGVPELSLHQEEKDLLNLIKNSNKFDKVIVLVNSGYAMDLGWLEEYGVDACLWIGYPGAYGYLGVAQMLAGKADPSGRLADTYATNSLSSPAMQNAGDFQFTNLNTLYKDRYLVYAEGIYVGYKYYETRYQDSVLGIHNATSSKGVFASQGNAWNYADEMAYTFGSGMSYADFTQELTSVVWDREAHTVKAEVKVTNNGAEGYTGASRDVVQLYVQLPWTEGQAEKSAIQLVDFDKTKALKAGESDVVSLEFSDYIFATYDEKAINGADTTQKGCYVFDEGDYYFAIGNNAHDALNNVLCARGVVGLYDEEGKAVAGDASKTQKESLNALDNTTYAKSQRTGKVVSNLFADRDLNYFIPGSVTYMTRADWNTFPEAIKNVTATAEIKDLMENSQYEKPADAPNISAFKFAQDNGLTFLDMKDVPFEDNETWDKFIDQLTVNELCQVLGDQMGVAAFKSVNMPAYSGGDGPDGHQGGVLFNAEVVIASTFSKERIKERGFYFAEESYYIGFRHIYAPGANLHRTPYSGRNFEYYSEDANMSYICGAVQTGEMARKGLATMIKHFAGNDQETNRHGVATFMTEQTYRQGPLKGFEGALADDNSLGLMTAFNRIGCKPTAADYETMQTVLREEWGFKGINMTDSSKDSVSYMSTEDCIHAGSELFNNDPNRSNDAKKLLINVKDGYMWSRVRDAAKHYFYAMSRSNHINGLSNEVEVQDFVPWWQPATIAVCVAVGVLTFASALIFVVTAYGGKKEAKNGKKSK